MDYKKKSLTVHKKHGGKLEVSSRVSVRTKRDLAIAYSPGVAGVSCAIAADESLYRDLVSAGKTVAIISDGSAVLGLGNIGPKASMPVMEGKAILLKQFARLNAFPIVLATQDTDEIVTAIEAIAPSFAAINLEDISAPRCFEIEERLSKSLDIPVFHDDQHGTAITVLSGLINALKVTKRSPFSPKIVINGAGAAGVAITKLLHEYGMKNIVVCDSKGIISSKRTDLNPIKTQLLKISNQNNVSGKLIDALQGADIFVGVSRADLLGEKEVAAMEDDPIVFALANPDPEIDPALAKKLGVAVLATGRSEIPNQINNVLVFPGVFKGVIEAGVSEVTNTMKIAAARALAKLVTKPTKNKIVPGPFDKGVVDAVARAIKKVKK